MLFIDNGKPIERLGRKAIGPVHGSQLPKGELDMRRLIFITVVFILLLTTGLTFADSQKKAVVDKASIHTGIIKVSYAANNNKAARVMIEKDGKRYTYSIKTDGTFESFPLQMGNGTYSVSVLENASGNKYSFVHKENINLSLSDQNKVFLGSVQNIHWDETMKAIKKAKEMTRRVNNDKDKVSVIYQHIVNNYKYDYDKFNNLPKEYIPVIDRTFDEGKGICYDYSSLFASMLRSSGIPVKLVKGYTDNVEGYHAWNEIFIGNKWIPVDSTFDSQMKAANKKFTMEKSRQLYRTVNIY